MSTHARRTIVPLCALTVAIAACGGGPDAEPDSSATVAESGAAPAVVTVTATEYAFDMPDTIPSGWTTFRLVDAGQEIHHMQLVKLEEGKTPADLVAALTSPAIPAWATEMGGVNVPRPGGGEASATVDVPAGSYAVVCFVPDAAGVPHVAKGMVRGLTVTPNTGPAAAEPDADVTVKLNDFTFALSTPLTAGTHTLRIENDGVQPHEIQLVRLAEGKTAADVATWVEHMEGPPPGEPIGGVPAFPVGGHAFVTVDLQPGNYALLCFVPDVNDGKPHVAHGMLMDVTVS